MSGAAALEDESDVKREAVSGAAALEDESGVKHQTTFSAHLTLKFFAAQTEQPLRPPSPGSPGRPSAGKGPTLAADAGQYGWNLPLHTRHAGL